MSRLRPMEALQMICGSGTSIPTPANSDVPLNSDAPRLDKCGLRLRHRKLKELTPSSEGTE